MEKRWVIARQMENNATDLAAKLNIPSRIADLLFKRGLKHEDEMRAFLRPDIYQPFYNPFELKDMAKAVTRILQAIQQQEKIVVYGDYDVDGMTATSLLVRQLRRLGGIVDYFVPLRKTEGYGLHQATLEKINQAGVDLLITVDCGITALEEVEAFKDKFDFIITDHHLTADSLPDAVAAIDPKRQDDHYPDENIAGVGVAFKLCQAIWQETGHGSYDSYMQDLELVAMGTIADMVPLLKENRKFASLGLQRIAETKIFGLQKLIAVAGLQGKAKIDVADIGFKLAPRFNAVGRMDSARKGIQLLLTDDLAEAQKLAEFLQQENAKRQAVTKEIFQLADKQVQEKGLAQGPALVLSGEGWHEGIVGLVASRLQEKYYRPAIVIGVTDGVGKGSCRSIEGLHMRQALDYCAELLERYGGHEMAAGLTVRATKIPLLQQKFSEFVMQHITKENYICKQHIEFIAQSPDDVTIATMEELSALAPFGKENEEPLFACFNVQARFPKLSKDAAHLFFAAGNIRVVGWNMADKLSLVQNGPVDIIFRPALNEYNGKVTVQFVLQDVRPARALNRNSLANLYRLLLQCVKNGKEFSCVAGDDIGCSESEFQTAREIFFELKFMQEEDGKFQLLPVQGKKQLYASQKFCDYLA